MMGEIVDLEEIHVCPERGRIAAAERKAAGDTLTSDAHGITIKGDYFIEWHRIATAPQLAGWLWHLAEKNWWDNQFTIDLIKAVQKHNPAAVRRDT
jgi:hypothetical protein